MLDYGVNPLWSNDNLTEQKFGFYIKNLKDIGLSDKTILLSEFVTNLYSDRLNPIYQMLPSFWSGEMCLYFQKKLGELFDNILCEIGSQFEIENKEQNELNLKIDIQKKNVELGQFLDNPALYFRTKNISYSGTDLEEKTKVLIAYEKWKQKEIQLLGQE